MKRGFGLIEVIVAAIVLAFLLIALNIIQKGNRESILRVRARDAANVVAQEVIDSISSLGSASVPVNTWACRESEGVAQEESLCRTRVFTGSVSRILKDTMNIVMPYWVMVDVKPEDPLQVVNEQTSYLAALAPGSSNMLSVRHQFAKHVEVTVNWKFKNSEQSINVSTVIR